MTSYAAHKAAAGRRRRASLVPAVEPQGVGQQKETVFVRPDHEWGDDPEHPVLPRAFEWRLVPLLLDKEPIDGGEPTLALTVCRGSDLRALRFWSPTELEIEQGEPANTARLVFHALRRRGLDHVVVRVDDFESSRVATRFPARFVEDITVSTVASPRPSFSAL